ncbi:hypothetical protein [Rhodosalinus sediminis]|uniref:hypothetical protein n=1 Tax=Rhodosalinus sediminis TaxID=1940533 RepID=UPI001314BAA8|nr:hypothetical protein [Rhodosalinus sediminis]
MRVFIIPFALAVSLGSAASAQGQTALQIARQAGVCGNAGIVSAERLPDGRIAVQCAAGPATPDPEITTQTTGGEVAGAGAGAGAAAPATGFVPLIAPAAAIAGVAGVAAAVAGGSSSSDTQ